MSVENQESSPNLLHDLREMEEDGERGRGNGVWREREGGRGRGRDI